MEAVLSDGRRVIVGFHHERVTKEERKKRAEAGEQVPREGMTWATVYEVVEEKGKHRRGREMVKGVAMCASMDNFKKETGRKLALTRAMLGWKKEDRRLVWEAYWAR